MGTKYAQEVKILSTTFAITYSFNGSFQNIFLASTRLFCNQSGAFYPVTHRRKHHALRPVRAGIDVANGFSRVAAPNGIVEVAHNGVFGVGDRVTVRDGRAVRVQNSVDMPVFFV